jgi:hypothetical protein
VLPSNQHTSPPTAGHGRRFRLTRTTLVAAAVLATSASVAVTIGHVSRTATGPHSTATAQTVSFGLGCDVTTEDYCSRLVADLGKRSPLTAIQRGRAAETGDQITQALRRTPRPDNACEPAGARCGIAPAAATIENVETTLAKAGFPRTLVRPAHADDLAPEGDMLIGVEAGPACVIVIQHGADQQSYIAGRLPHDAGCIAA